MKIKLSILLLFISIFCFCEDKFLNDYIPIDHSSSQIIKYESFTVSFNNENKIPNWTMYRLWKERSKNNFSSRGGFEFTKDKKVKYSPSPDNYKHSEKDKGHFVPAEDMRQSSQDLFETFYTTNISPQIPEFNRGIWKELEELVRYWAEIENKRLLIISGPIIYDCLKIKTIGYDEIVIPHAYYKIIYDYETNEMICFLIPHIKESCKIPLQNYITNIYLIEKYSGYTFFKDKKDIGNIKYEKKL